MGCACGKRRLVSAGGETLGYRVTLPNGTVVPPEDQPPFFSHPEARAEVRAAGGGTVRRITRT